MTIPTQDANIILGKLDASARYGIDGETQNFSDFSLQRFVTHEIQHIIQDHAVPEGNSLASILDETAAIMPTDAFMAYYWNEEARINPTTGALGGTPEWDVNGNFLRPNTQAAIDMRERISELSPETIVTLSENIGEHFQQLYDLRDTPEAFSVRLKDIATNDKFIEIEGVLDVLVRPAGPDMDIGYGGEAERIISPVEPTETLTPQGQGSNNFISNNNP